jgi:holo-[acyl-carrier protein] synthase
MRILGLGVDIVEIARIDGAIERQGQAFLDRLFSPAEQAYCKPHRNAARCYAVRFAAKEAVAKAFGTGIGAQLGWRDVEVCRRESGEPFVVLHGTGAETARRLGIGEILVSLSHSERYAVANAIAIGESGVRISP